jgi:hypothetical protein
MTSLVNPHFLLIVSSFYVSYVYVSYASSAEEFHLYLKHANYINIITNYKISGYIIILRYRPSICLQKVQNAMKIYLATSNPCRFYDETSKILSRRTNYNII